MKHIKHNLTERQFQSTNKNFFITYNRFVKQFSCIDTDIRTRTHTHMHIHTYIYSEKVWVNLPSTFAVK